MANRSLGLLDLNDDVLRRVLTLCEAEQVLALERVSRRLWQLISEPNRNLWLSYLRNLDDFHAPDLAPQTPVDSLASDELKSLVSRAIRGAENWSSNLRPRIVRKVSLDLRNNGLLGSLKKDESECDDRIKFVSSRFVGVQWSEGYIQCWDLSSRSCIWTYPRLGDFNDDFVITYDACHHINDDRLTFVLVERTAVGDNVQTNHQIKWVDLDIQTRRARLRNAFAVHIPSDDRKLVRVRMCSTAAVVRSRSGVFLFDNRKDRIVELNLAFFRYSVADGTVQFAEDKLILTAFDMLESHWVLFVLNVRGILAANRFFPQNTSKDILSVPLSALTAFHTSIRIPLPDELFLTVSLFSCQPTWRNEPTAIYLIAKLDPRGHADWPADYSYFRAFQVLLIPPAFSSSSPEDDEADLSLVLPPRLSLERVGPRIALPLVHPFCVEGIHRLSHGGRALLSSLNSINAAVRCFALPFSRLLSSSPAEGALQPITFGKELVAPGEIYMDKYSGAVAYPSKDEKKLIVQYYD